MKKLTLAISAIAAAFGAATAQADVSVSGSGSAAYIAPAGSGDSKLNVGQFVSFGLSTTNFVADAASFKYAALPEPDTLTSA